MRKLYNEEYKLEFIDSLPQYENKRIKDNYKNLFYTISENEFLLNKDFCNMNVPETKMTILSLQSLSVASLITTITLLRDYNNWCIATGKTNCENSLLKIQTSDFDFSFSIQTKLIKSPEHLEEILARAFNDDETAYTEQGRLITWLLYYGFTTDEIKHLKISDIQAVEKKIYSFTDDVKYCKTILKLMDKCSKTQEAVRFTKRGDFEKVDTLFTNEYIIRAKVNSRADPNDVISDTVVFTRIRSVNTLYSEKTGQRLELTIDRISKSGDFYRLYKCEKRDGRITPNTLRNVFNMNYDSKLTVNNEVAKKKADYENWKKAFELQ